MPKTTRCLFVCINVNHYQYGNEAELTAQYDLTVPLERRFNEASPNGSMKVMITNPATKDFFTPGQKYYLDIHEAETVEYSKCNPAGVKPCVPLPTE